MSSQYIQKARDFVYENGVLWERALFAYFYEGGSLDRLHQCLLCYKNPDNGFAHGLEHDVKTPDSHPLALEYILGVMADPALAPEKLFAGSAAWVESMRNPDGSLKNPPSLLDYPHAPWWNEGGQTAPDSITGNLLKIGLCTPSLADSTRRWVQANITLEKIRANDWLFMAYHGYDYFFNVTDFPDVEVYREAVLDILATLAEKLPENQYHSLLSFAPTPDSPLARRAPKAIQRALDYLTATQQDDGAWPDQHNLKHWYSMVTIHVLRALQTYGRL